MADEENLEIPKQKTELEQLQEMITAAKQHIQEAESSSQNAKKLVTDIETYYQNFDTLRKKLDDEDDGLEVNLTWSQTQKTEIDALKKASDENLAQMKATLSTVEQNIEQMNTAYAQFTQIKSTIDNPDSGLEALLTQATALKNQIDALKQTSDEQLNLIKTNLVTTNDHISEMTTAYDTFTKIKAQIDNEETGLEAILKSSETTKQEIIAVKKQSDTLFQEIKKFRDDSQSYHKEIGELKTASENSKNTIATYEQESQDYKDKISHIYKLATGSSLANSFDIRKKELELPRWIWFGIFVLSTIALAIVVYLIFKPVFSGDLSHLNGYTWYRLTITSPLLFLIAFASTQYSKERNLLERYAFKSATALALESYTTLLRNTFDQAKSEEKVLDFVLSSMNTIYQEPYEPIKESKLSFGVDGKLATIKAELSKKMEDSTKIVTHKVESAAQTVTTAVADKISEIKSDEK